MKKIYSLVILTLVLIGPLSFVTILYGDEDNSNTLSKGILHVIQIVNRIKPGMTRADVENEFRGDGGINSFSNQRFVYRKCSYIKIDVEFKLIKKDNKLFNQNDIIIKLSKPYLEPSYID
jgi:hypothetical protein